MRARFDKEGRPLPETGRGCGCQQCADANEPRYERREQPARSMLWHPLVRRMLVWWNTKEEGPAAVARPSVD
ncbi:MAG TPA: hypothetical protein VJU79_08505 [Candidatus Dormibacteraeota bacterium]|nr:hypothetical protein [Candidatus Dormibacteraeota bacterium]